MNTPTGIDFVLWNTVIAVLVNGELRAFASFGDYNKQDVLESLGETFGLNKLEILERLPSIWSRK